MKKFLLLLSVLFVVSCSSSADEEPAPVIKYTLTTSANPATGGTISPASGQHIEGATVNTSVVESFHNIQNLYRNKNTTYDPEEYDMRIELAEMHFDEGIKGEYVNGEKAHATEYSKGPRHLPKRKVIKRLFIPKIDQDYFDEMLLCDSLEPPKKRPKNDGSEPQKKRRKKSTLESSSAKVPSKLGVKDCTDQ